MTPPRDGVMEPRASRPGSVDRTQRRTRKINTRDFQLATRSTQREVNRQIVLNLIREHQPISRAELSRRMHVRRSALTPLVRELVGAGVVIEVGTAASLRGRRPTLLCVRTSGRLVVAADVRPGHTSVALADIGGRMLARDSFETPAEPESLVALLGDHIEQLLEENGAAKDACQGVGLVIPGMVDNRTGRVLYAPRLGWREVELRAALESRLGVTVQVESAPIACAMARLWLSPDETRGVHSFAYASISDGVGVGLVLNGDAIRGEAHTAGEFGHVQLDPNGPQCVCGRRGCWEAFCGNAATVGRYVALAHESRAAAARGGAPRPMPTLGDVILRARGGEEAAITALREAGTHIGRGLAAVANAFNPGRIYIGGEITAAWELIEEPIRRALTAGTLTEALQPTPIAPDRDPAAYRLSGAVALVAAPTFAAPSVG